jgi:hypothetical protein
LFLKAVRGCRENIGDKKRKNEELETSIFHGSGWKLQLKLINLNFTCFKLKSTEKMKLKKFCSFTFQHFPGDQTDQT